MKRVFIKAEHSVNKEKRILAFSFHHGVPIGSIEIPGKISLGGAVISEVDEAWHMLMTPTFRTDHIPAPLKTVLDEVIQDYETKPETKRWRFCPEKFGNSKQWFLHQS